MPDIIDRVVEEINTLGTTRLEIAKKLGVSQECVRFWTDGYSVPKTANLAKFHAAGLDIFYIITGKRVGDIVTKNCRNCLHFNECETCSHNNCRGCHDSSNWLWEGYTDAKN